MTLPYIEQIAEKIQIELCRQRDKQLEIFLESHGLTPKSLKRKGYELVIEYHGEQKERWKLCKVVDTKSYRFTHNVIIT